MSQTRISNYGFWLLNIAAYATWLTVALLVIVNLPTTSLKWQAAGYFLAFGVAMGFFLYTETRAWLPHLYFAIQLALVLQIYYLSPAHAEHVQTLLFVLSAQSMLFLSLYWGFAWVIVFFIAATQGLLHAIGWENWLLALPMLGGYLFFASFGAALQQANNARRHNEELLAQLQESHEQLKAYTTQAEELAVAEERNRLAREMHDALGHRPTVAVVQLEGAQRLIPKQPERAAAMVGTMRDQLKVALADLRQAVATLRSPLADDLPLPTAVSQLSHTFQEATGLPIHLTLPDTLPDLPTSHRLALFRAAQEGLTNVQRHANATQAWLSLTSHSDQITLTVADDGQGVQDSVGENGRFGLQGLAERANQLGGTAQLKNRAEGGAELRFEIPIC